MDALHTGTLAGYGSFRCCTCQYVVSLVAADALPECPGCGGTEFERASLFDTGFGGVERADAQLERPAWLDEARDELTRPGEYLAYDAGDRLVVVALSREWTRIGRSLAADLRFDDPTVSRRHALIVRQADGVRILDDRSLNGVFVNGERVEWSALVDGDEILVGCHSLRFIDTRVATGDDDRLTASDAHSLTG
jgi:pSer/pThr/pTyr-binding forkhead associated (FHA) protein